MRSRAWEQRKGVFSRSTLLRLRQRAGVPTGGGEKRGASACRGRDDQARQRAERLQARGTCVSHDQRPRIARTVPARGNNAESVLQVRHKRKSGKTPGNGLWGTVWGKRILSGKRENGSGAENRSMREHHGGPLFKKNTITGTC